MANKDYKILLENLDRRVNPDRILLEKSFSDELGQIPYKYALQFVQRAMRGVEPEYTKNTLIAGNKVKDKLKAELINVDFEFQGSVMTNTHLKGYSDIDLLTITNKFYTLNSNSITTLLNESTSILKYSTTVIKRLTEAKEADDYKGVCLDDLKALRLSSERILISHYSANVDVQNEKSIKVVTANPKRDVDIVIANWYKNANFFINENKAYKGIQIYEYDRVNNLGKRLKEDFPFLSIQRINERDSNLNGRLKKMIRFVKAVRYNSAIEIDFSSFIINAICYDIDVNTYSAKNYSELVQVVYNQLVSLSNSPAKRAILKSVDGNEFIFKDEKNPTGEDTERIKHLNLVITEIKLILADMLDELK